MGGHITALNWRITLWLGLLLGVLTIAAQAATDQALIPPGATVVLLNGLAGDVESENQYHGQLRDWVEIVEASRPERLFVLCDSPESVQLPAGAEAKVLKASRAGFQGLAGQVGSGSNTLVVIVWGHGGRQGITPVFHVRGPRLAPADFEGLAKAWRGPSRWILEFRSSGAFARQLAAEQREIISSESDTQFTSDPVGIAVLLKLARSQPAVPFEVLAEAFGRATDAWYKERNLARTEEPTFWRGKDQPRLLARHEDGGSAAAVSAEDAGAAEDTSKPGASRPSVKSPADLPTSDLPAAWKEIKRVEPRRYPGADGVTLRRRISYTLGSNPAITSEQEEFIQVLTMEGKHLGDFDLSYTPPFEDLEFMDCEVLRPDGKLVRLDPNAIREAREEPLGDYQTDRRKVFSLPGMAPGAVLHVRYRTTWKEFPLPHISLEVPLGTELPVVEATVQVSVPKQAPFHFALERMQAQDPAIQQGNYGSTYSWRFADLPAYRPDLLIAPGQRPRLLLSTFPDWPAFADWYGRVSQLTDEVTPEIAARAAELTKDAKSEREKVVALYNYVTGLRYVAVPMGVNSFRPHAAANVLQNQYGDCKDKANLFNALLHALKIEAHLVLVPRFSQAHEALPGLAFNHAISRVKLGNEIIWVDTTDDVCRFGLLPPGDPGRKVLVIDGQTHDLTQLPPPSPDQHQLSIHGELDCTDLSDALPITLGVSAQGYPDYEMREAVRAAKEHGTRLPLLATRFRPVAGAFALDRQSGTAVSALDENFSWQAEGSHVGLVAPGAGGKWLLHAPFWLPKEWDLALHHREAALYLNQGYPLALQEEFDFVLPGNSSSGTLPSACENSQAPLKWRIEWSRPAPGRLKARLQAELVRGELSAAETPTAQKQLRALLSALAGDVTLDRAGR